MMCVWGLPVPGRARGSWYGWHGIGGMVWHGMGGMVLARGSCAIHTMPLPFIPAPCPCSNIWSSLRISPYHDDAGARECNSYLTLAHSRI